MHDASQGTATQEITLQHSLHDILTNNTILPSKSCFEYQEIGLLRDGERNAVHCFKSTDPLQQRIQTLKEANLGGGKFKNSSVRLVNGSF